MSIRASFESMNAHSYLKSYIAIDCFVGELELTPQIKHISSMIKNTLGQESEHSYFPVSCVALDETAAEKWVALTRRVIGSNDKERDSDKHLVRHLYDLYQLSINNHLSDQYDTVIKKVLRKEQDMFQLENFNSSNLELYSPQDVLLDLRTHHKWEQHWDFFLAQMVYHPDKPSYEQALEVLEKLAPLI